MKVMVLMKEQRKSSALVQLNLQATPTRAPPISFRSPPSRLSQSPRCRKPCRGPGRPRDDPGPTDARYNRWDQMLKKPQKLYLSPKDSLRNYDVLF